MITEHTETIQYYLDLQTDFLNVNQLLSKTLTLTFVKHECLNCHLERPVYRQGFCKTCFFDTPSAGDWIMRPELSKAHFKYCR
jgi:hypothetical protein